MSEAVKAHEAKVLAMVSEVVLGACAQELGLSVEEAKADEELVAFITRWVNDPATFSIHYTVASLYGFAYAEMAKIVKERREQTVDLFY